MHKSKDVTLYRQGGVNFILNAEKDSFAHSYFLLHGPSVCALAFRTGNVPELVERASRYRAQTFRGRIGPNELMIPALRGLEGSLIYLVDRFGGQGSIYDVDFKPPADAAASTFESGLLGIDHISQVMPRGQLDSSLLFYRAVLGFDAEPTAELLDPYGLVQSRVVESRDRTIRLPLNSSTSPKTTTARLMSVYSGAGVHHIAISTGDIFGTIRKMRSSGVPILEIPEAYYANVMAQHDLPADLVSQMRNS